MSEGKLDSTVLTKIRSVFSSQVYLVRLLMKDVCLPDFSAPIQELQLWLRPEPLWTGLLPRYLQAAPFLRYLPPAKRYVSQYHQSCLTQPMAGGTCFLRSVSLPQQSVQAEITSLLASSLQQGLP